MHLTLVYKLSLSAGFLVLFTTTMVGYLFYTKTINLLLEHAQQDIAGEIRNAGSQLKNKIKIQHDDVLFLANTPPIQGMLRAMKSKKYDKLGKSSYLQWQQRLQSIFSTMLGSKYTYLKINFIDETGQDLIVVRRDKNSITVVNNKHFQREENKLYIRETKSLPNGAVYLSEINLNREHGKVRVPHQQVLRSATPVYDKQRGSFAGVILITSEIGPVLLEIQKNIQNPSRKIYITNDRGGYLLHPDIQKQYGFDLGKRYRIQEDIPRLAKLYLPENHDTSFIQTPNQSSSQYVVNVIKIFFDPARSERFITVGMTELLASIIEKQTTLLNDIVIVVLALAIAVTLLAVLFSYRLSRPIRQITQVMDDYTHQRNSTAIMPIKLNDEIGVLARSYEALMGQIVTAQENQKEMNRNLESMVIERTKELEISEIYQRSIVESMVDGLIMITQKGDIESFNPAAENIFGYKQKEVLGKNIKLLMPEPYHSEHDGYLKNYHKSTVKKIIGIGQELTALRKDGSCFPLELAISEIFVNGKKLYTGVIRDITERRQIEKMKDEFISTVSHELRTPLTSIRGSLGLLTSGMVGEIPDSAVDMLKIAGNNTERLLFLINDLLDLQKIKSGKLDFKYEKLDVVTFLEQVVQDNAAFGEQFGVKFVITHKLNRIYVLADEGRLMQVMSNLLSNAAKFSPSNSVVDLDVKRKNGKVCIMVTDYGSGIPDKFKPDLFEKFTQSDSSDSRKKGGTGLGLNITKFIVEKHGGKVGYITKQGEGTSFYFELDELTDS